MLDMSKCDGEALQDQNDGQEELKLDDENWIDRSKNNDYKSY